MSESIEVTVPGSGMTPEAQVQATITVGSVVVAGLAVYGGVILAKKLAANAMAAWKFNREMKKNVTR